MSYCLLSPELGQVLQALRPIFQAFSWESLYTLSPACCWVKPKPVDGTYLEKR